MIAQKRCPSLGRLGTPRRFPHPALHRALGNIKPKHLQFAMDARRTPCGILRDHAKDQLAQFLTDAFSAHLNPTPREPRPIQLEPCTVPANDGLWPDEDQLVLPFRPEPPQDHPEQLAGGGDLRARIPLLQNHKLLAKSQVLKQQVATRAKMRVKKTTKDLNRHSMKSVSYGDRPCRGESANSLIRMLIAILANHSFATT